MLFPDYLKKYIDKDEEIISVNGSVFGLKKLVNEQRNDALKKERKLLLVTGLSGAGKDSVIEGLMNVDSRFGWLKTCTTRPRRPEENEENDSYIRLTEEAFQNALASGDVIESVEYAGNHYCSLSSLFKNAYDFCEIPVLRVDPKGANFYMNMWRKSEGIFKKVSLINVFVVPQSIDDLRERLLKRSRDPEFVEERIKQTKIDIPLIKNAEYIAVNETGKLETLVADLKKIL